jgi:hypothetical protein
LCRSRGRLPNPFLRGARPCRCARLRFFSVLDLAATGV